MSPQLAFLLLCLCAGAYAQNIITTVAGGSQAFRGNGGPAAAAALGQVVGAAVDASGNVYATDTDNNLVVRISPAGVLTVIAGNGDRGYEGEGRPATGTPLNGPVDIAISDTGEVYFAEIFNDRVRKITASGALVTVAGGGAALNDNQPATTANLSSPSGIAFDPAGNLYIADSGRQRIRRVNPAGIITTFAGTGARGFSGDGGPAASATFDNPVTVAVDALGAVFVSDRGNNRIRRISLAGAISTFAGGGTAGFAGDGGPATAARFDQPGGIRFDAAGNLFIADSANNRIRRIDLERNVTTIAGSGAADFAGDGGPAPAAAFSRPSRVAVDLTGNLYVSDANNNRLRAIDTSNVIRTVAGTGSFRYFGDNGPGRGALLSFPAGLAIDRSDNLYIADSRNHRIRKLSPEGIISTAAGDGRAAFSGDGGPATAAALNEPAAVALDASGNFYIADTSNNRVRRVAPDGTISTVTTPTLKAPAAVAVDAAGNLFIADTGNHVVRRIAVGGAASIAAGNGTAGFSGDGGPAASASLNEPSGLAFDAAGNLLIADTENQRVRRVTGGAIATIAGNGQEGFGGDDVPAQTTSLWRPTGLWADGTGALYIADRQNNRVRRISASGVISTVAGRAGGTAAGDGGPAAEARISSPRGIALDRRGNLYFSDAGNDRIRAILVDAPTLTLSRDAVNFTSRLGGPPTAEESLTIASSVPGIPYTVALNGSFLFTTTPLAGVIPAPLQLIADPDGFSAGRFQGTLTVSSPVSNPPSQSIPVTFEVSPGQPARPGTKPSSLTFSLSPQSGAQSLSLDVSNEGSGLLRFTAAARTSNGGSWLRVAPASAVVSPVAPAPVNVTADPAGLAPGTYSGRVTITGSDGTAAEVPVTMTVTAFSRTILLSQTGLTFTAVVSGGAVPPQTFGILNIGRGAMDWTVETATLSGGDNWLSVSPGSGSSDAASLEVPLVTVSINPANLAPGDYYGQIRVKANGADNTPQSVAVALTVLPPGSDPGPVLRPTGLIFTAAAGSPAPGAQTVLVSNLSARTTAFTSGRIPQDPDNWFVHQPQDAAVQPDQATRLVVQPQTAAIQTPGFRRGTLTLQFADGTARTIALLLVVGSDAGRSGGRLATSECAATQLFPVFTSLSPNFSVPAAWPTSIEAKVTDDCGQPLSSGSVVATFSNGDPALPLVALKDGRWTGSWQARNARLAQVTVNVTAARPTAGIRGSAQLIGGLVANPNPPLVEAVSALAPGGVVRVTGTGFAAQPVSTTESPLPTELGNMQVIIGGSPIPLRSVDSGSLEGLLPFDVGVNTRYPVLIRRGVDLAVSERVTVAPAQPAILTVDPAGAGQGLIYVVGEGNRLTLADAANPARAGDTIQIHCTGLGAVDPAVAAGSTAPADPLARLISPATVRIGDVDATASAAALLPGATGIYFIRVVAPAGVAAGGSTPVVVTVAGQSSAPATMAVR